MLEIFKNSLLFKILNFIFLCYEESMLAKTAEKIREIYRQSVTRSILRRYVRKDAYFRYSVTYKLIDALSRRLSYLCTVIHKGFADSFNKSAFFSAVRRLPQTGGRLVCIYTAFFIAVALLVYLICCYLFLSADSINVPVSSAIAVLIPIVLIFGNIFRYVKYSFIYKAVMFLFGD